MAPTPSSWPWSDRHRSLHEAFPQEGIDHHDRHTGSFDAFRAHRAQNELRRPLGSVGDVEQGAEEVIPVRDCVEQPDAGGVFQLIGHAREVGPYENHAERANQRRDDQDPQRAQEPELDRRNAGGDDARCAAANSRPNYDRCFLRGRSPLPLERARGHLHVVAREGVVELIVRVQDYRNVVLRPHRDADVVCADVLIHLRPGHLDVRGPVE